MPNQQNKKYTINLLPAEVLQHIFSFLSNEGATNRALVCTFWAEQQEEATTEMDLSQKKSGSCFT